MASNVLPRILTAVIVVFRRYILLIVTPYKTMRRIAVSETDTLQLLVIAALAGVYFLFSYQVKEFPGTPLVSFGVFLVNISVTIAFLYGFSRAIEKTAGLRSYIFTVAYTMFPTLTWFFANSIFFVLLPPPRTLSIPGKVFSIFFIAFSLSLLAWKLILFYLAIRFSSGMRFTRILYIILLYLCLVIPYSILLYHLRISRIPFI